MHVPPLSLYCHFPWCVQKCPYCDFNSHTFRKGDSFSDYTYALCEDIRSSARQCKQRVIHSIFLGGGTPSMFAASHLERVLTCIHEHMTLASNCEITIEINPNTHKHGHLRDYRSLGINRASIGAQSFSVEALQRLGRTHSPTCINTTYHDLRKAGFNNINLDVMYALPEQSPQESLDDIARAVTLQPEHISWYELTIEPNTYFHAHRPELPNDDSQWEMFEQGIAYLDKYGYSRYEVSAFSKSPSLRCRHNLNYWKYGDYIGCGAGAHSKITKLNPYSIRRFCKHKSPKAYQLAPVAEVHARMVPDRERIFEFMLNNLRLLSSISIQDFESYTCLPRADLHKLLQQAHARNLLEYDAHHIQLTSKGRLYLNDTQEIFLA